MPDDPPQGPREPLEPFRPLPDPTWRERAAALAERARALPAGVRVGAGVVVCVVAAVGAALSLRAGSAPAPEDTLPRASAPPPASSTSTTVGGVVVVQAAGAVVAPGLYRLPSSARVDDLITAAGGFAAGADVDRVNLAEVLRDGEKVYVPRVGEAVPAGAGPPEASAPDGPIDLNTATVAELDSLPGIGPATAQAIVDYRAAHGRFVSVDDLLNVRGIGPAKLDAIRELVRV